MGNLIIKSDFEGYVDLSTNIDDRYINPHIRSAQREILKPILCEDLYDVLVSQNDADSLTYENAELYEYVKECLIFYAYKEYLFWSQKRSTPQGVVKKRSDQSDQLPDTELADMINNVDIKAKFYEGELRKFLKDNEDDYPLWRDSECGCEKNVTNDFWITKV
jgi:hypothetical protein